MDTLLSKVEPEPELGTEIEKKTLLRCSWIDNETIVFTENYMRFEIKEKN